SRTCDLFLVMEALVPPELCALRGSLAHYVWLRTGFLPICWANCRKRASASGSLKARLGMIEPNCFTGCRRTERSFVSSKSMKYDHLTRESPLAKLMATSSSEKQ